MKKLIRLSALSLAVAGGLMIAPTADITAEAVLSARCPLIACVDGTVVRCCPERQNCSSVCGL